MNEYKNAEKSINPIPDLFFSMNTHLNDAVFFIFVYLVITGKIRDNDFRID